MRLARYDEIVDAMARAIRKADCALSTDSPDNRAIAALDAMLEAAVRLEVGVPAISTRHKMKMKYWDETEYHDVEYLSATSEDLEAVGDDALILKLEPKP
jgi:hypothetical protein